MPEQAATILSQELPPLPSQYQRDILVENVILSRADLIELFALVENKTNDARKIQIDFENPEHFESREQIEKDLKKFFRIKYNIYDSNKNSISGSDSPNIESGDFPDDIYSVFLSNSELFKSIAGGRAAIITLT